MLKQNIDKIINELNKYGRYYVPSDEWYAVRYASGNIIVAYRGGREEVYTPETFRNEFLPSQPNYIKMAVEIKRTTEIAIAIPDDVDEGEYVKYAMEHKREMIHEESWMPIMDECDDVMAIISVMD